MTKLAFINAAGGTVPSVFVYPRKKVLHAMFEKGPPGWARHRLSTLIRMDD